MSTPGLYIYGVGLAGDCAAPATPGLEGAAVRALPCGEFFVLLSDLAAPSISRTRRNMLAHTAVLEAASRSANVLPLRFGTLAPDAGALCACIEAHAAGFRDALRAIAGRIELGLKATWRDGGMYAALMERDADLRALRDRLRTRPAAETYYERIELGRRVEAGLAEFREAEAARLTADCATLAERRRELPLQENEVLFNHAYLLPRAAEPAFDAAVGRIAESHGAWLDLRYVGPMPPFNFVTLRAGWLAGGSRAEAA